jgi:hypothetical protein
MWGKERERDAENIPYFAAYSLDVFCLLVVLGIKPGALHKPGKHSVTELHPQPHCF